MKITGITVIFTYEDGEIQDVSDYLPNHISSDLEVFADCWEEDGIEEEEV